MKLILSLLVLIFSTTLFSREYSETKHLELSAKNIEEFNLDCGSGFLRIKGVEGLEKIKVEAEIVVKDVRKDDVQEFINRRVTLELEERGGKAYLKSEAGNNYTSGSAQVNLTIEIPKKMSLFIDDGSGSMEIRNIAGDVEIDDGSGSMDVEKIAGNLKIDDGSGSVDVWDIQGDVDVDDGSGSITIEKIGRQCYRKRRFRKYQY